MRSTPVLLALIACVGVVGAAAYLVLREPNGGAAAPAPRANATSSDATSSSAAASRPMPNAGAHSPYSSSPSPSTPATPAEIEDPAAGAEAPAAPVTPLVRDDKSSKPGQFAGRVLHPRPWPVLEAPPRPACGDDCSWIAARGADPRLRIDATGGIADVLVEIALPGGERFGVGDELHLRLVDGVWSPRVVVVPLGASVIAHNDGRCALALRWQAGAAPELVAPGASLRIHPEQVEHLTLHDERHPWNVAQLFVTANRFTAVTDAHGAFAWPVVPQGEYGVLLWHETLGKMVKLDVPIGGASAGHLDIEWRTATPPAPR